MSAFPSAGRTKGNQEGMMKTVLALFAVIVIGCATNGGNDPNDPNDPPNNPPSDPNDPPNDPPQPTESCLGGDNCVCPQLTECFHTCSDGGPECHVQGGGPGVHVTCNNNGDCHVECADAASCEVDCGGSADCHVTCPGDNCTVNNCVGPDCVVSCDGAGDATLSGTTATCP
jgi:hypothetical protein